MANNEPIDVILQWTDYENMPKFELQERALADDKKAQRIYLERYGKTDKNVDGDIEKNNPNRDSKGRFTFGAGGPQGGGGGAGGAGEAEGGAGGSGGTGEPGEGKDITSELAEEYGSDGRYTQRSADLQSKEFDPATRGDPTLEDIAKKQGFDGKAEMVDQEAFDQVVAEGGTVTYRGITDFYDSPSANDATYISGDTAITENFAQGEYFAGHGVYGNGTYTSVNIGVAKGYASEDGKKGSVVTMVIKPSARIATPEQWEKAKLAAKQGTGGFTAASDQGRILAAQGFDGFTIAPKSSEHWASETIVILNRKALVVLKK